MDVSAFTKLANAESTFQFPMTERGNEVDVILKTALDKIMLGQGEPAEVLPAANEEINALFQ